jgi:hypothetical protein
MRKYFLQIIILSFGLLLLKPVCVSGYHDDESTNLKATIIRSWGDGKTKNFELQIRNVGNSQSRLKYLMVGTPCGDIRSVSNMLKWPGQPNILDKATGIFGIKFTNNTATVLQPQQTIEISFSIYYEGDYCSGLLENWRPRIAYNFGSAIINETMSMENREIPVGIDFENLESFASGAKFAINTFTNAEDSETTIDFVTHENERVTLELFSKSGVKTIILFIGHTKKGINNLITFNNRILPERSYIFRLSTDENELFGKLVFPE